MEEEAKRNRREIGSRVLDKVGEVVSAIKTAKHVEQVICSLHCLAVLLFPIDPSLISGRTQIRSFSVLLFLDCHILVLHIGYLLFCLFVLDLKAALTRCTESRSLMLIYLLQKREKNGGKHSTEELHFPH